MASPYPLSHRAARCSLLPPVSFSFFMKRFFQGFGYSLSQMIFTSIFWMCLYATLFPKAMFFFFFAWCGIYIDVSFHFDHLKMMDHIPVGHWLLIRNLQSFFETFSSIDNDFTCLFWLVLLSTQHNLEVSGKGIKLRAWRVCLWGSVLIVHSCRRAQIIVGSIILLNCVKTEMVS